VRVKPLMGVVLALALALGGASGSLAEAATSASARPGATPAQKGTPRVACSDPGGRERQRRPEECTFVTLREGHTELRRMIGLRWSRWGRREALGTGTAYREWPRVRVRLYRPVRASCAGKGFTRAAFRFVVDGGTTVRKEVFRLTPCGFDYGLARSARRSVTSAGAGYRRCRSPLVYRPQAAGWGIVILKLRVSGLSCLRGLKLAGRRATPAESIPGEWSCRSRDSGRTACSAGRRSFSYALGGHASSVAGRDPRRGAVVGAYASPARRAARCGEVHTSRGHAFSVRGVGVRCGSARKVARRYVMRRCFGKDPDCVGVRFRCTARSIDFPSRVRCTAGPSQAVRFVYDVFP
jgi:hypothetical protein